jgi:small multidrug resistance pump
MPRLSRRLVLWSRTLAVPSPGDFLDAFVFAEPFRAGIGDMSLALTYALLGAAVVLEVIGTSALLACAQFTRPGPSVLVVVCYVAGAVLISFTFRALPLGIVYAIWSGAGMVMVVGVGWLGFGQRLDQPALVGVSLILAGVVILNLFSESVGNG